MTPEDLLHSVDWQRTISIRMDAFERQLGENTATTAEVRKDTGELVEILNSWKGAMKVFEFIGKLAKPVAAIITVGLTLWAAWKK